MKLGLYGINVGPCAQPEAAARVARAAEAAGFESVWTAEHVVLPDPQAPPSPIPAATPLLDPAVALAFLAAHTQRLRLATGIIILPQRNPVVLAKELASLDVLSGGRLIAGFGVGYLKAEFDAIGAPFARRAERMEECLDVLLALWTQPHPQHDGPSFRFAGIDAHPRPVQQPHPPIVLGATTPPAFRRTVRRADGWYGFAMDVDTTSRCLAGLEQAARRVERPAGLGALELTVTPPPGLPDADTIRRYEDLGVTRLVLLPLVRSADELVDFVGRAGAAAPGGAS
ncbi:LLM class F420-dependent oxidoreductase [Myxococcota bacterium]|nr:LLM class F420-dependent oxidoreductase [Myxococcota bacterium]MCZ7620144.1 LLM class F420-dependent oxidoreductase [Myxococcota bacterium]